MNTHGNIAFEMNTYQEFPAELCAGIPGASTANGRTCWNEVHKGDHCEECAKEINEHQHD